MVARVGDGEPRVVGVVVEVDGGGGARGAASAGVFGPKRCGVCAGEWDPPVEDVWVA